MELKEWATRILSGDCLSEKLLEPDLLTDEEPGSPLFWDEPTRPKKMQFQQHTKKDKLPPLHELFDQDKRALCLHRFAGHELLAVEIMAYALLAFPYAPRHFRRGLANTLKEEQGHVRLYTERLKEMGVEFGDLPLYKHFWAYTPYLKTPSHYVSVMSLTFEMANLDFAPTFAKVFTQFGDDRSADLMRTILEDEIAHVCFGWNWLKKMKKEGQSEWEAWRESLPPSLPPHRAKGKVFHEEHRKAAGVSDEWLKQFQEELS